MTESPTKQQQRGSNAMTEQQKLNARARAIGAQINVIVGWLVVDKDGNQYAVRKAVELDALIAELERMESNNAG